MLTGNLVERARQTMAVDPLVLSARIRFEVGTKAPHDPAGGSIDQADGVGLPRADQDVVGVENRAGIVAMPMVRPERFGAVDFQVAPDVVRLARDASAQVLEPVRGEAEFVEVVTDLPFPDDSPVGWPPRRFPGPRRCEGRAPELLAGSPPE